VWGSVISRNLNPFNGCPRVRIDHFCSKTTIDYWQHTIIILYFFGRVSISKFIYFFNRISNIDLSLLFHYQFSTLLARPAPSTLCPTCPPPPFCYATLFANSCTLFQTSLACAFSVWLKSFVIVLTSTDSGTSTCNQYHRSFNHLCFNQTTTYHISTIYWYQ